MKRHQLCLSPDSIRDVDDNVLPTTYYYPIGSYREESNRDAGGNLHKKRVTDPFFFFRKVGMCGETHLVSPKVPKPSIEPNSSQESGIQLITFTIYRERLYGTLSSSSS